MYILTTHLYTHIHSLTHAHSHTFTWREMNSRHLAELRKPRILPLASITITFVNNHRINLISDNIYVKMHWCTYFSYEGANYRIFTVVFFKWLPHSVCYFAMLCQHTSTALILSGLSGFDDRWVKSTRKYASIFQNIWDKIVLTNFQIWKLNEKFSHLKINRESMEQHMLLSTVWISSQLMVFGAYLPVKHIPVLNFLSNNLEMHWSLGWPIGCMLCCFRHLHHLLRSVQVLSSTAIHPMRWLWAFL